MFSWNVVKNVHVVQHIEKGDFAAEMFSRNMWKQAAKNKGNNKNFQQYFMYNISQLFMFKGYTKQRKT